ncbi:MAG: hypothetical protein IT173_15965 [Acidobacteria bacterium]|nr:hypothetical protein [Acidobacteriota bacterium]
MRVAVFLLIGVAALCAVTTLPSCSPKSVTNQPTTIHSSPPAFSPASADPAPDLDNFLVVPGQSLGQVALGMTVNDVAKIFPYRRSYDQIHEEGVFKSSDGTVQRCAEVFHKSPFPDGVDLFVYFREGVVIQIEGSSSRYHSQNGLGENAKLKDVWGRYPHSSIYVLEGSGSNDEGGKDKVYLVAEANGVAFEFRYSPETKSREISKFIIFPRNHQFLPGTCVTAPQSFVLGSFDQFIE